MSNMRRFPSEFAVQMILSNSEKVGDNRKDQNTSCIQKVIYSCLRKVFSGIESSDEEFRTSRTPYRTISNVRISRLVWSVCLKNTEAQYCQKNCLLV